MSKKLREEVDALRRQVRDLEDRLSQLEDEGSPSSRSGMGYEMEEAIHGLHRSDPPASADRQEFSIQSKGGLRRLHGAVINVAPEDKDALIESLRDGWTVKKVSDVWAGQVTVTVQREAYRC